MNDAQAAYAIACARVELRMEELRQALDRHEESGRWEQHEVLERVERGLAELTQEVAGT